MTVTQTHVCFFAYGFQNTVRIGKIQSPKLQVSRKILSSTLSKCLDPRDCRSSEDFATQNNSSLLSRRSFAKKIRKKNRAKQIRLSSCKRDAAMRASSKTARGYALNVHRHDAIRPKSFSWRSQCPAALCAEPQKNTALRVRFVQARRYAPKQLFTSSILTLKPLLHKTCMFPERLGEKHYMTLCG